MRIATIGAGISGLTIAAALRHFDPQVEVQLYERDTATAPRFQGYSLGIKGEYGISVLRQLGIFEQLRADMVPVTNFVSATRRGRLYSSCRRALRNTSTCESGVTGSRRLCARRHPTWRSTTAWTAPVIGRRLMRSKSCSVTVRRCKPTTWWRPMVLDRRYDSNLLLTTNATSD
jgi:2-polyprenyl-6-methoxyphenol hydroxylase-like FAD-dependent oxidoreductase